MITPTAIFFSGMVAGVLFGLVGGLLFCYWLSNRETKPDALSSEFLDCDYLP